MSNAAKQPTTTPDDWNQRYAGGDLPWDTGLVDRELRRVVESGEIAKGNALELGCGTGINAVYLAASGFTVTAIDFAPLAVEKSKARAKQAGATVNFLVGDVTKLDAVAGPFDFIFDRGCYHCVRRAGQLAGYLKTVERLTHAGSKLLVLAGNPDADEVGGPPRVKAAELCGDFEKAFRIERLQAMRFEDAGHIPGPLGWHALLVRR